MWPQTVPGSWVFCSGLGWQSHGTHPAPGTLSQGLSLAPCPTRSHAPNKPFLPQNIQRREGDIGLAASQQTGLLAASETLQILLIKDCSVQLDLSPAATPTLAASSPHASAGIPPGAGPVPRAQAPCRLRHWGLPLSISSSAMGSCSWDHAAALGRLQFYSASSHPAELIPAGSLRRDPGHVGGTNDQGDPAHSWGAGKEPVWEKTPRDLPWDRVLLGSCPANIGRSRRQEAYLLLS